MPKHEIVSLNSNQASFYMRSFVVIKMLLYCIIIIGNVTYVDFIYNATWEFFNEENFTPTNQFTAWYESKGDTELVVLFTSFVGVIIILYIPAIWTGFKLGMSIIRQFVPNEKSMNKSIK